MSDSEVELERCSHGMVYVGCLREREERGEDGGVDMSRMEEALHPAFTGDKGMKDSPQSSASTQCCDWRHWPFGWTHSTSAPHPSQLVSPGSPTSVEFGGSVLRAVIAPRLPISGRIQSSSLRMDWPWRLSTKSSFP